MRCWAVDSSGDPAEAAKGLRLTEEERTALAANTPERLIGAALARAAGCGSASTCESTCTATCTVTFTSIQRGEDVVDPIVGR